MPFRSEKQRRYLWANEPKIAREWTEEYGSKPVKAKIGKYQDLRHPEHDIKPVEHMEDKVSSKERVERLLEERKTKKDTKKKLAGLWGGLTNTNWDIMEQISGGYIAQDIAGGAGTTTLSVSDGSTGATLAHRIIEFTGAITGNRIVTIPLDVQTFYILKNTTTDGSDAYTVEFKYVTGSGGNVTFSGS